VGGGDYCSDLPGRRGQGSGRDRPSTESERFRAFTYQELISRDKASLDTFWLRDESVEDSNNLPPPEVIAAHIVVDLEAALQQFSATGRCLAASQSSELTKPI
jgi:type I restriction enzyme M protein